MAAGDACWVLIRNVSSEYRQSALRLPEMQRSAQSLTPSSASRMVSNQSAQRRDAAIGHQLTIAVH
jgi:hypothetical protein